MLQLVSVRRMAPDLRLCWGPQEYQLVPSDLSSLVMSLVDDVDDEEEEEEASRGLVPQEHHGRSREFARNSS